MNMRFLSTDTRFKHSPKESERVFITESEDLQNKP